MSALTSSSNRIYYSFSNYWKYNNERKQKHMYAVYAFLLGLAITVGLGFTVVWYLKSHLKGILIDLCGTEQRGDFWMAFSNVILILVPVVFAMQFHPAAGENVPAVFQLNHQLKWSLVGLVASVLALGAILSLFIRREIERVGGK